MTGRIALVHCVFCARRGRETGRGPCPDGRSSPTCAEALAVRLMSPSIAATAITAVCAAMKPRMATERPAIPSLALRALSMKAAVSARGRRIPNTTSRSGSWGSGFSTSLFAGWRTRLMAEVSNRLKPDYGLALPKTAARSLLTSSAVTAGAAAPQLLRT